MSTQMHHLLVPPNKAVGLLAWLLAIGCVTLTRAEERPPNVLLIMADDVGREVLGCYGGTSYATPNIDALCRTGTRFDHCYSMPVCHPTRIALMTGRYPFRFRAGWGGFPDHVRTIGHVLAEAGYATAVAGKWQLALLKNNAGHARQLGFGHSALFGWHEGPRYHNPLIYRNGAVWQKVRKPEVYGPDVYTDFLIDFMTSHRDRPFFAYYPMALCHEISDDFDPVPPPGPDGRYVSFAGMVADMDRMVGKLVLAVDRLGLRKDTVILFTTDNGSPQSYLTGVEREGDRIRRYHRPVVSLMGDRPVRGGKGTFGDAGTRVPLIVNWPGTTPAGRSDDSLVDFSDFLPTLTELAGAEAPEAMKLDGYSLAPCIQGQRTGPRAWVFCELRGKCFVRDRRWKLYGDGRLFDMQADPAERHALDAQAAGGEAAAARTKLASALQSLGVGRP